MSLLRPARTSLLGVVVALLPELRAQDPPVRPPSPPPGNRLGDASSPYLRQHRDNPVHWFASWPDALARARATGKPIFLSIGYSACHWCHVMAHESFADPATAAVLNEHFICIKVDREERPDLDEIYMAAVQSMGQPGGWPLSVWLTPDGQPFFGGTYFPPQDSGGRPGFRRVCQRLADAWRDRRQELEQGATELGAHLRQALSPELPPGEPAPELLRGLLPALQQVFDPKFGGFGTAPQFAPKFPSALELMALLQIDADAALPLVVPSLQAMQRGGLHDQLGGGFHRYSTDRRWVVPHFEKMTYDNALLAQAYLAAHRHTGDATFAATARQTLDYLLREMRDPRGGFWSSTDAQSEGSEGRFFVWRAAEVDPLLGDDAELAKRHFGITAEGNFDGANVLTIATTAAELAAANGRTVADVEATLAKCRDKLLAARNQRVKPATDDKVLVAWNGLVLRALASGYRELGDERWLAAARDAATFLLRELIVDGRLRRSFGGGKSQHAAVLEDHAALADGLLALFEVDSDPRWLTAATQQLRFAVEAFGADDGSFHATAKDHEALLVRSKLANDTSTPSGTGLLVRALLRGGLLLGDEALYERGVAALRAHHAMLANAPGAMSTLLGEAAFHLREPREVIIAGRADDARTGPLLAAVRRAFADRGVVVHLHPGNRDALVAISRVFDGKVEIDGAPAVYVCRRGTCERPITDAKQLVAPR